MIQSEILLQGLGVEDLLSRVRDVVRAELKSLPKIEGVQPLCTEKEIAEFLNISVLTCQKWRAKGRIPFMRIGNSIRYDQREVINALQKPKK
jgi:excisionase family DNA binding protein